MTFGDIRKQYNAANAAKFSAQDGFAVPRLTWVEIGELLAEYDEVVAAFLRLGGRDAASA